MPRRIASMYDVRNWLSVLRQMGFRRFRFAELPTELQVRNILHKAATEELIKCIGRDKGHNAVRIWEISSRMQAEP